MSALLHAAIEQTSKHYKRGDNYEVISTRLIIDSLEARGFELEGVNVSRTRLQDKQGFQKHLVTMKYKELETKEGVPTVIIQNSHDATRALKFHTGFIRFACMNGLILGDGIEETRMLHNGDWKEKATNFLDNYSKEIHRMEWEHDKMKGQYMSASMIAELAHEAGKIRYDSRDILDTAELNLIRRPEDVGNDAYKVYNRIQEALINGLFQRRVKNKTENGIEYSPWGKAAKITSNDEIVRINKDIRSLVLEAC